MVSTTARECPGAFRCPSGRDCFAEDARARAAEADVVVVNTHLYGAHLASGGAVLPPHEVVVFDEAHEVEEVMTDSLGVEIGPGRFRALAAAARPVLDDGPGDPGRRRRRRPGRPVHRVLRRWPAAGAPRRRCVGDAADRTTGRPGPVRPAPGSDAGGAAGDAEPLGLDPGSRPPPGPPAAAGPATTGARRRRGTPALAKVVALAAGRVGRLVDHLRQAGRDGADAGPSRRAARRDRAAAGRRPPGRRPGRAWPPSATARWPGSTDGARAPACGSRPSTWGRSWPSGCGAT